MRYPMPMPTAPIGILQDFRPIGHTMRIDEPLWPVVRETARQILRCENIVLKIPERFTNDFQQLLLEMSDFQPAKIEFPVMTVGMMDEVFIHQKMDNQNSNLLIAYIGLIEPETHVRWVKMKVEEGWNEIMLACRELLEAGYPGCIGCGGPNSELPWDEEKNRATLI